MSATKSNCSPTAPRSPARRSSRSRRSPATGLDGLRAEIARQLDGFEARRATGVFRLPLDRAFVIKGHGTVVTGTAMGAEVGVGQKLRVLPGGAEVRVRSIQVHCETGRTARAYASASRSI